MPFISKIPLIGALFSSRARASNNTETVVLISPYIIGGEAHTLMLEKSARVQHQQKLLRAELDRIGSELDERVINTSSGQGETYDNDWNDPSEDEDLWGD